jgi:outer membrane protein OmpA-like peptidoglycan-associated protein
MKNAAQVLFLIGVVLCSNGIASAKPDSEKYYPDGHGGKVFFPLGDVSFADEVVFFTKGTPAARPADSDSSESLGPPNYDKVKEINYMTLGCKGILVLRFVDNVLVDTDGPDLYVFEIGPDIEPTKLSISKDGINWVEIGNIEGATAAVDISSVAGSDETFSYVRLEDLGVACKGAWPGADIDAVGAIGAGIRIALQSSVLFDFDKSELKPEAAKELQEVIQKIKSYGTPKVTVEGHTDSVGSLTYNKQLSEARAEAVRTFFQEKGGITSERIKTVGYGETKPLTSNDSEEGRELNRRVEILIYK